MFSTQNDELQPFIQPNDLVVNKSQGGMSAAGFKIDSALMASGAPCATVKSQKGGSALASLKGLAVPAGLLFLQRTMANTHIEYLKKDAVIDNGLFDKLVSLASGSGSGSGPEKKSASKNKVTKRRRAAKTRTTRRSN